MGKCEHCNTSVRGSLNHDEILNMWCTSTQVGTCVRWSFYFFIFSFYTLQPQARDDDKAEGRSRGGERFRQRNSLGVCETASHTWRHGVDPVSSAGDDNAPGTYNIRLLRFYSVTSACAVIEGPGGGIVDGPRRRRPDCNPMYNVQILLLRPIHAIGKSLLLWYIIIIVIVVVVVWCVTECTDRYTG